MYDVLTACYNLCEYIYKGYDCRVFTQSDSVNPYALPVSCQKLVADYFKLFFIGRY